MKALKLGVLIAVVALFAASCGAPESTNTAAGNQNASSNPTAKAEPSPTAAQPEPTLTGGNSDLGKKSTPTPVKKEEASAKPAPKIDAAALYAAQKCAGCHGADGKGNPKIKDVPDFTDAAWQKKESDAELIAGIKKGKKPMPAFEGKLTDDEIKALVAYVRSFAKK